MHQLPSCLHTNMDQEFSDEHWCQGLRNFFFIFNARVGVKILGKPNHTSIVHRMSCLINNLLFFASTSSKFMIVKWCYELRKVDRGGFDSCESTKFIYCWTKANGQPTNFIIIRDMLWIVASSLQIPFILLRYSGIDNEIFLQLCRRVINNPSWSFVSCARAASKDCHINLLTRNKTSSKRVPWIQLWLSCHVSSNQYNPS